MSETRASGGRLGDTAERDYSCKLRLFNALAEPELRAAIDSLALTNGMRVLDAGCGTGEMLGWLAAAVAPDGLVVGADLAATHLAAAQRSSPQAPLLQADLTGMTARSEADVAELNATAGELKSFYWKYIPGLRGEPDADYPTLLLQTAVYAGVPAANTGFHIALEEMARP